MEEGALICETESNKESKNSDRIKPFKPKHSKLSNCLCLCSSALLILTVITYVILLVHKESLSEFIYSRVLKKKLVFTENSTLAEQLSTPQSILIDIYLWNCTNPDQVTAGAIPNMTEVGPYTYSVTTKMINIKFNYPSLHSTSFQRKVSIHHSPRKNAVTNIDTDMIYSTNLPTLVYSKLLDSIEVGWLPSLTRRAIHGVVTGFLNVTDDTEAKKQLFSTVSLQNVKEILEGVDLPLVTNIKKHISQLADGPGGEIFEDILPLMEKLPDKIGFLSLLNGTVGSEWVVNDGTSDVTKVMNVMSIDNQTQSPCWHSEDTENITEITSIKGGDGIFYPPLTDPDYPPDQIQIYAEELQRSINLTFVEKKEFAGLPTLRYEYGKDVLNSDHDERLEDLCIHDDEDHKDHCKYTKGTVYMNQCMPEMVRHWLPTVLLSNPHLLYASENEQVVHINGYTSNVEKHGSFVEFEPTTGIPVRMSKRLQVSVGVQKGKTIKHLKKIQPLTIYPILWVDISFEEESVANLLRKLVYIPMLIVDFLLPVFFFFGLIVIGRRGYTDYCNSSNCLFNSRPYQQQSDSEDDEENQDEKYDKVSEILPFKEPKRIRRRPASLQINLNQPSEGVMTTPSGYQSSSRKFPTNTSRNLVSETESVNSILSAFHNFGNSFRSKSQLAEDRTPLVDDMSSFYDEAYGDGQDNLSKDGLDDK